MAKKTASRKRRTTGTTTVIREDMPPNQVAAVWTLTEEGRSQRWIAEKLGVSAATVNRILGADPFRLETVRARQREARADKWKSIENLGLEVVEMGLTRLKSVMKRRGMSKKSAEELHAVSRSLQASGIAAKTATTSVQLLTGAVTERVGVAQAAQEQGQGDPELTLEAAIAAGVPLESLPVAWRDEARKRMAERVSR